MIRGKEYYVYSLLTLFVLFCTPCFYSFFAAGEDFKVRVGVVTDGRGEPLEGAKVTLRYNGTQYCGYTNEMGYAEFDMDPGAAGLDIPGWVEKEGYETIHFNAGIKPDGNTTTIALEMEKRGDGGKEDDWTGDYTLELAAVFFLIAVLALLWIYFKR